MSELPVLGRDEIIAFTRGSQRCQDAIWHSFNESANACYVGTTVATVNQLIWSIVRIMSGVIDGQPKHDPRIFLLSDGAVRSIRKIGRNRSSSLYFVSSHASSEAAPPDIGFISTIATIKTASEYLQTGQILSFNRSVIR